MVLQAIKNHSNSFKNNSFMGLALLLSDKLDITKKRLALEGFTTKGIRQIQYIEDVIVDITDEQIMIRFVALPQIDFQELNQFSFIPKIFKAIMAFSDYLDIPYTVYFNDKIWQYPINDL